MIVHDYSKPGAGLPAGSLLRKPALQENPQLRRELGYPSAMGPHQAEVARLTNVLHEIACLIFDVAEGGYTATRGATAQELRLAAEIVNAALLGPEAIAR